MLYRHKETTTMKIINHKNLLIIGLIISNISTASATWVMKQNDKKIDQQTIQNYLDFQNASLDQVPVNKRKKLLENWFIRESLAQMARDEKLDQDEKYQQAVKQFQQDYLAKLALSTLSKKDMPDFSERAKEIYQSEKDSKYQHPLRLKVKQVILNKEQQTLAEDIHNKLLANTLDIDTAIKQYSIDPQKHRNNGSSYWFRQGQKPDTYYQHAEKLSKKQPFSDVFELDGKLYILAYQDRKEAGTDSFASVKDEIIAKLKQDYIETQQQVIVDKIKQDFAKRVEINPEFLK